MASNEKSGTKAGKLASKAMRTPSKMTPKEIRSLGGSVLTQRPDRSKAPKKKK